MLDKKYNHKEVESNKYQEWIDNEYFKAGLDKSKEPFCIVIPPPNVTGKLHLGHAWDTTLQDIIIRYKKMNGYDTLWLPGMDHAAIATEVKVINRLKSQGISKYELGREGFLEKAWEWKEEFAENIRKQWAKLGLSLDYSKERFTLDEGLNKAVTHVFINLYNKGLIYRGERIINWDPVNQTALSNEEVIYKDLEANFYHLKYMIEGTEDYLEVATTRPETLFGDTAVAVNPKDERYKHLIGKNVILPIVNKPIPIVGDEHADPEFGTGVVKITPAHDPNDFEVGNRHNLERIVVINTNGTMNENAFKYQGMDRFVCRDELLNDLEKENLLIKKVPMVHSVGHSERTDAIVEPYLSKQWFVKMRPLADHVLEMQKTEGKVNFVPERFEKTLNNWMENCYDWCISRQLWWGHRIPAWYKEDEVKVQVECPGDGWVQDNDVLDTWFSSALWPFSTLGWNGEDEPEDFKRYYPNQVLVTAYDIIFFWVARMIFEGLEFTGKTPFKDCLMHGLIRDKDGRKMSKSLGNGVDPMDVIEEYGADSLRFFLTTNSSPGMDLRYDEEKVKSTWNFINKLWNASRFVLMNIEELEVKEENLELSLADKWILTKKNKLIEEVTNNMEKYEFHNVGNTLYSFIWNDFCDWYIELSKTNMNSTTQTVLLECLTDILKLLHPFMPYVTEEIYQMLPIKESKSIMISTYPKVNENSIFTKDKELMDKVIEDIIAIRNKKATNGITKDSFVMMKTNELLENIFKSQLKIREEQETSEARNDLLSVEYTSKNISIMYYYQGSKEDDSKILEEINQLELSIARRESLLENENYIKKAPVAIVEADRIKLKDEQEKLATLIQLKK